MIFAKNELPVICYTVEKCTMCKNMTKRKFKVGDFLFNETTSCPSCEGKMIIEQIFGESTQE